MKNVIKILGVVLIIAIIIILVWNIVYSKYFSSKETEIISGVANPKIYVQMEEKVVDNLNEDIISYEFSVKNYDETSSDTSFNYYISFNLEDTPLLVNLYRINEDEEEQIDLNEYTTANFEKLELGETENFYRLELEYDKESDKVLDDDFKISICLQAIQEEAI